MKAMVQQLCRTHSLGNGPELMGALDCKSGLAPRIHRSGRGTLIRKGFRQTLGIAEWKPCTLCMKQRICEAGVSRGLRHISRAHPRHCGSVLDSHCGVGSGVTGECLGLWVHLSRCRAS